jgi:threonine dehydratase
VASLYAEFFRAVPDLDVLYVPIGMGSGIVAAIAARNALGRKTEIVGVVAANAPAYARSIEAGKVVPMTVTPTIADGMACRTPVLFAVEIIARGASRIVEVSDAEVRAAMNALFTDTHNVAEGAGAAALAAALQDRAKLQRKRVGLVLSGGNVDRPVFADVLRG